jgi:hypothetical protein
MGDGVDDQDDVSACVLLTMDDDGGIGINANARLSDLCAFAMFLSRFVMTKFDEMEFIDFDDDDDFRPGGTVQ